MPKYAYQSACLGLDLQDGVAFPDVTVLGSKFDNIKDVLFPSQKMLV